MSEIVAEGTGNADVVETLLDVFTPLVSESKIHFNDDGINIRAVDPAKIGMAWADLSSEAFESWDTPGAATVGINIEGMTDRVGKASGELVTLAVDMETRHLNVSTDRADMEMAMIDPDSVRSEPDLPELDLPNVVTLSREQLDYATDVATMSSDHIEVLAEGDTVQFIGEGDVDANTVSYGAEDTGDDTDLSADVASLFSAEYFEKLVDGIPKNTDVTVHFGDEYPIHFEWAALEGNLEVKQMLAPRISSR